MSLKFTSKSLRNDEFFLRSKYETDGKWGIPFIKKENIDVNNLKLISISDTKKKERKQNKNKGLHFFVDDKRFECVYRYPTRHVEKFKQYKFVISPDFSIYGDMDLWRQMESVAMSRWCGAYWQENGIKVVPSITWGLASSFEFCFHGVEKGSIVAIGMIGCKSSKFNFMRGYNEMLRRIEPKTIICFGKPFLEMGGNIIEVDYIESRRGNR